MPLAIPTLRPFRASDVAALRELTGRIGRILAVCFGVLVMIAGVVIAPLPGPMGLPVIALGLIIVLRSSFAARRRFIRLQRAHPKVVSPIRRFLRREGVSVTWQQYLRLERLLLPARFRVAGRARRSLARRFRGRPAVAPAPFFAQ